MLPLGLFTSATFSAATVVGLLCNLGFVGELFVMSLYLQKVRGLSPLVTGLLLVPQMAATIVGSMTSGRVMAHRGPRLQMLIGLCLGAAGLGDLAARRQHSAKTSLTEGTARTPGERADRLAPAGHVPSTGQPVRRPTR